MITFAEMQRRLKRMDMQDIITSSIEDTRGEMISEQGKQMYDGFLKDGKGITPDYAFVTVAKKIAKGHKSSNVTLQDTGEFKKQMFVDVRESTYVIDSARMVDRGVLLSPFLERYYGPSIWGLGGDYKARYIAALRRAMEGKVQLSIS